MSFPIQRQTKSKWRIKYATIYKRPMFIRPPDPFYTLRHQPHIHPQEVGLVSRFDL